MSCCENYNIKRYENKIFCHNCYKIHEPSILQKRVIDNSRIKFLRKNFNRLDNNIILFLDESLKEIQTYKNLKKISNIIYINSLYKFYIEKANIPYKQLNDKKLKKFDDNIFLILEKIYSKYPYYKVEDEFERMFI